MKKIIGILTGAKEEKQTTQLNENMEECGMPGSMGSMPSTPPVTMSVNLNAQGVDNIRELLNLMRTAEAEPGYHQPVGMPMPAVGLDMPIAVTKISGHDDEHDMGDEPEMGDEPKSMPAGDDGDRGMAQIRDLISKADKSDEAYANEPDEKYASVDDVIANGNDLHRQKTMHPATAGGDNAMAVREASIRAQLDRRYKEIKEGHAPIAEWGVNLVQPRAGLLDVGPKDYDDGANVNAMYAKYDAMIKKTQDEIKQLKASSTADMPGTQRLIASLEKSIKGMEDERRHNHVGTNSDDATNALRKQAIAKNELTPGQWLQKATQYFKGKITGKEQPGVEYDRMDTSKQAQKGWATPTPYKPGN